MEALACENVFLKNQLLKYKNNTQLSNIANVANATEHASTINRDIK